jgi:hypothetical protein
VIENVKADYHVPLAIERQRVATLDITLTVPRLQLLRLIWRSPHVDAEVIQWVQVPEDMARKATLVTADFKDASPLEIGQYIIAVVSRKTKPTIRISTGIYDLAVGDDRYFLFRNVDWQLRNKLKAILSVTEPSLFQIGAVFMSGEPCYADIIDKYLYNNAPVRMSWIPNPPVNKFVGALIYKTPL